MSKKSPPKLWAGGDATGERWLAALPRLANAFELGACGCGGGEVVLVKLKLAKSSRPPKEFCGAGLGVCWLLIDPWDWCCGFGAEA